MASCVLCSAVLQVGEDGVVRHLVRRHPEARLAASLLVALLGAALAPGRRGQAGAALLLLSLVAAAVVAG